MVTDGPGATPFGGHGGAVSSVAFSPDGATLASAGADGVRLWDVASGEQRGELPGRGEVLSVAFSPDGARLASGGSDGVVRLWDVARWEQRAELPGRGEVLSVAFSPNGARLASAGDDAVLWDAATGKRRHTMRGGAGPVLSVAFSPDGATVVSAGHGEIFHDGLVRLWGVARGEERGNLYHNEPVSSLAFSPDGALLASGGADGIRLWDVASGEEREELYHDEPVSSLAFSPDGTTLASAGAGGVRLWDVASGEQRGELPGGAGPVSFVAFSPDGATLASAGAGGVRLWDVASGEQRGELPGHQGPVHSVAFSPDSATLASAGDDKIRPWDATSGEQRAELPGHGEVSSVAFSPDGTTLASGGDDGAVRLWDVASWEARAELPGHGEVSSVAFSPDGTTLASGGDDGIRLWDVASGEQRAVLSGNHRWVKSVAFSPDGATLASGGQDGIRLWDVASGEQRAELPYHDEPVNSVAFSPDGALLASGGADGVRLWDVASGGQRAVWPDRHGWVYSVAFSPDGATLARGGSDGVVRLWDVATREQHAGLLGHTGRVESVAFSPDGRMLASCGDISIRIWNPRTGSQVDGTGFHVSRAPSRPLAGIRSDSPSVDDMIGVSADVETLADLIAAVDTSPPLAIALVGDWGAGKSSVMLQVKRRIELLAEMSRNNPGLSVFASNVRQVQFNAWHYSDEQLWAALVTHLFEALAAPEQSEIGDGPADAPSPQSVKAECKALRAELEKWKADEKRLTAELNAVEHAPAPRGYLAGLSSPFRAARVLIATVREFIRDVSIVVVVSWILLGGMAYAIWHFFGSAIGVVAAAIAAFAGPVWRTLRHWHEAVTRFIERQRSSLESQKRTARQKIGELQRRLALIDAATRLAGFLQEAPSAYERYRGLLGQVRADLERLSRELVRARADWLASGSVAPTPLERIVLYIDDLDRCPPPRVVQVLEAIHLMLALDLFVVVVAVDARWLIRSLEYHYRELFNTDHKITGGLHGEADVATPVDYLDKIFQIPYTLLPPPPEAAGRYLRSLLPEPAVAGSMPGESTTRSNQAAAPREPFQRRAAGAPAQYVRSLTGQSPRVGAASIARSNRAASRPRRIGLPYADPGVIEKRLDAPAVPNLRPRGLQLNVAEVEFMTRLGALLPTPRAAKRLVNLYRLVRIGVPAPELATFSGGDAGGPYQVVQILLALLSGSPTVATSVFQRLLSASADGDIADFLKEMGKVADVAPDEQGLCQRLGVELENIKKEIPISTSIGEYQRWCPFLARYSFHTRTLAGIEADRPQGALYARTRLFDDYHTVGPCAPMRFPLVRQARPRIGHMG